MPRAADATLATFFDFALALRGAGSSAGSSTGSSIMSFDFLGFFMVPGMASLLPCVQLEPLWCQEGSEQRCVVIASLHYVIFFLQ